MEMLRTPLRAPAAWLGRDERTNRNWIYELREAEVAERHLLRLWLTAREHWSDGDALLQQGIPKKDGVSSDAAALHGERGRGSHRS
ncbi:MAG: hypothetical protein ACHQ4J_11390 [Candidatus Binatia bacterium]